MCQLGKNWRFPTLDDNFRLEYTWQQLERNHGFICQNQVFCIKTKKPNASARKKLGFSHPWFKVSLGWLVNAYSSHSIHQGGGRRFKVTKLRTQVDPQSLREPIMDNKGIGTRDVKGRFCNRTGWDHGGDHIGLSSSLGMVPNYVMLVLGNESEVPIISKVVTHGGLESGPRKLVIWSVITPPNIYLRLINFLFLYTYVQTKGEMLIIFLIIATTQP